MMKRKTILCLLALMITNALAAQYLGRGGYPRIFVNGGLGTPIFQPSVYGSAAFKVHRDFTVGAGLGYRSSSERSSTQRDRESASTFRMYGNYYLGDWLNLPEEFDIYIGPLVELVSEWSTTKDLLSGVKIKDETPERKLEPGIQVGGRYYFLPKLAIWFETTVPSQLSFLTIGLSVAL